ncbi:MAG: BolA family transcriptional regulator [Rhodobacteraceae bacterium]|nr:BolA family transcriptional regulator [Paracoccaceae bacterium]
MAVAEEMRARLVAAFAPTRLEIHDESEGHRGHAGWREGGETHFRIVIAAGAFAGMGRIARHRAVHAALGPDLVGRIHALALDIGAG